MTWHLAPLAAFDLETTGVDVETDRIVTATLVRIHGRQTVTRSWIVNPGIPIPAEATAVHGITDETARRDGQNPTIACAEILAELDECWTGGRPVIIYNASFDLTLLDRELRRHCQVSLDGLVGTVIDPFVIDKELDRYRKGERTLTATCAHYGVKLEGAHTAEGDALAAARVAWRLAQVYPEHLSRLEELNELQAMWRRDWAEQFEEWLALEAVKAGEDPALIEAIDPHWPIRPYQQAAS